MADRYPIIASYTMKSDGTQAAGSMVIRHFPDSATPFVVHFHNTQDGGYHCGNYCKYLGTALIQFAERVKGMDPDGSRFVEFYGGQVTIYEIPKVAG